MYKQTVLITGASRGIGRAIARRFARVPGYQLVINCRKRQDLLEELKEEIEILGTPCLAVCGDVGSFHFVKKMHEQIMHTFGKVDILINNAGISYMGLLTDMDISEWEAVIQTNLTSVFNCCRVCIPSMVQQKVGKIINISSVWGNSGASCEVAYSASKGGVNTLTKALARELAPSNIQVNAIAFGMIRTEMNSQLTEEDLESITCEIPSGRIGEPEEAADFVFELSLGKPYLTGQVITFDGGWQ